MCRRALHPRAGAPATHVPARPPPMCRRALHLRAGARSAHVPARAPPTAPALGAFVALTAPPSYTSSSRCSER
eukprot:7386259-Prymnesium_polylepis.1